MCQLQPDPLRDRVARASDAAGVAAEALRGVGQVVEGMQAAEVVLGIADRMSVEMPICEQVARVVGGQVGAREAAEALLARAPAPES